MIKEPEESQVGLGQVQLAVEISSQGREGGTLAPAFGMSVSCWIQPGESAAHPSFSHSIRKEGADADRGRCWAMLMFLLKVSAEFLASWGNSPTPKH